MRSTVRPSHRSARAKQLAMVPVPAACTRPTPQLQRCRECAMHSHTADTVESGASATPPTARPPRRESALYATRSLVGLKPMDIFGRVGLMRLWGGDLSVFLGGNALERDGGRAYPRSTACWGARRAAGGVCCVCVRARAPVCVCVCVCVHRASRDP